MSKLERKSWFQSICTLVALFFTLKLFQSAGLPAPSTSIATGTIWVLCIVGLQRAISFALWLAVLLVAPKYAMPEHLTHK